MTRTLLALVAVFLSTAGAGCMHGGLVQHRSGCSTCGTGSRPTLFSAHHCDPGAISGPPAAQVAYPYYTVRGPRDFLLDNPPPLGP